MRFRDCDSVSIIKTCCTESAIAIVFVVTSQICTVPKLNPNLVLTHGCHHRIIIGVIPFTSAIVMNPVPLYSAGPKFDIFIGWIMQRNLGPTNFCVCICRILQSAANGARRSSAQFNIHVRNITSKVDGKSIVPCESIVSVSSLVPLCLIG